MDTWELRLRLYNIDIVLSLFDFLEPIPTSLKII